MSLLRNPNEDPQIKPVIPSPLPADLGVLKKAFEEELKGLDLLLGKVMQAIHKTVNKLHADPEQMWQQIDFQAEAIEETVRKFCTDISKQLESKSPPETLAEEKGIHLLVQQLEWDLASRYSAEDYVETLLVQLSEKGPEATSPLDLLSPAKNLMVDPRNYAIAGYPGSPLPTGSWWLYLAHRLGSGYRMMTVADEGSRIEDPLTFISLKTARQFDPEILVGAQILIPLSFAFPPNVNQGCYLVKNSVSGIEFSQTEQFRCEKTNLDLTLSPDFSYTLAAEAKEGFDHPPTISSFDDHCATLHHQKNEASLTIPLTRGSPYITLLYRHCTPLVRVTEMAIAKESIQAYRYCLVVAEEHPSNPKTQISLSQAQNQGIKAQVGDVALIANRESLEGQVFTFQIDKTKESYAIFCSAPIQFKTVCAKEKILLPEGVLAPKQHPEHFLTGQAGKPPYSSVILYEQDAPINGLEATAPCAETTLRIAKIPARLTQENGLSLLLQHAWVYATGGRMSVIEEGSWKTAYTLQHINPFAHFQAINPPRLKAQELIIALLEPDCTALTAESPQVGLIYETLLGEARCAIASGQELHFLTHTSPIQRADANIPLLNQEHKQSLVTAFVRAAEQLDLKPRAASTLQAARHIQSAAEAAHAMYTLLQTDPELIDHEAFMRAFQTTLSITKAGLDDYLSNTLLRYDNENKIVIAALQGDLGTASGQDHHRLFGHLIRAAADLHEISPEWFDKQRKGIVDLLVNEICCPYDHNPYFPKIRLWDPYTGLGRGSGASLPQSQGMSDESIGEDLSSLQGIALWAKTTQQKQLEHFAATLAARLSSAAQSLCLPGSPTSIYTQKNASEAAQTFAKNALCSGIRNDIQTSLRNTLNLDGSPLISTLAMQAMGNCNWIDLQTAQRAFEIFFDYRLNSFNYEKFSSHFSRSPIFQNKIRKQAAPNFPIERYMTAIITLVPLIARVSPNAADAVLNWYMKSHELAPNDYPLVTTAQYPLIKMQILAHLEQEEDPISTPLPENDLPFLPESSNTSPLQFWLDKTNKWLHSPQLGEEASKLAENLRQEILALMANKGTIQDLHLWARAIILPLIRENTLSTAPPLDFYPFCVITQTDLQEILRTQAPEKKTMAAEAPQLETPPLFSPSNAFIQIKAEITAYLSERTIQLYHAQSFLGIPQEVPSTDSQWRKLSSLTQLKLQQLQHDIASARKPNHWTALAVKYGFKGTVLQIQRQAAYALHILSAALSARLALFSFLEALTEIANLEMGGGSREELAEWADAFDTSGLTAHDLAAWNLMQTINY